MNKEGYTLVELVATVVVLAIIMTIGIVSYNSFSKHIKERQYKDLISEVKIAAANYYSQTNQTEFQIQDLIDFGLLSTDSNNGSIFNPIDNSVINCYNLTYDSTNDDFSVIENSQCTSPRETRETSIGTENQNDEDDVGVLYDNQNIIIDIIYNVNGGNVGRNYEDYSISSTTALGANTLIGDIYLKGIKYTVKLNSNETLNLPSVDFLGLNKNNYIFSGWSNKPSDGTLYNFNESYEITAEDIERGYVRFYAQWKKYRCMGESLEVSSNGVSYSNTGISCDKKDGCAGNSSSVSNQTIYTNSSYCLNQYFDSNGNSVSLYTNDTCDRPKITLIFNNESLSINNGVKYYYNSNNWVNTVPPVNVNISSSNHDTRTTIGYNPTDIYSTPIDSNIKGYLYNNSTLKSLTFNINSGGYRLLKISSTDIVNNQSTSIEYIAKLDNSKPTDPTFSFSSDRMMVNSTDSGSGIAYYTKNVYKPCSDMQNKQKTCGVIPSDQIKTNKNYITFNEFITWANNHDLFYDTSSACYYSENNIDYKVILLNVYAYTTDYVSNSSNTKGITIAIRRVKADNESLNNYKLCSSLSYSIKNNSDWQSGKYKDFNYISNNTNTTYRFKNVTDAY